MFNTGANVLEYFQYTNFFIGNFQMKEKPVSEIDIRIVQWAEYLVKTKQFKSEADLLRYLSLGVSKLSDARKGKAGFRTVDIGIILMKTDLLNADWVMTGRGEMLITKENKPEQELINELKRLNKTNFELQERYEKVLVELGRYKERLDKSESSAKIDKAV